MVGNDEAKDSQKNRVKKIRNFTLPTGRNSKLERISLRTRNLGWKRP